METLNALFIYLGIKVPVLFAAAAGAIVSLITTKGLGPIQSMISLFVGFITSVYLTPILVDVINTDINIENGVAFLLGVIGMNLVTGIINLSNNFSKNPMSFLKKIRGQTEE